MDFDPGVGGGGGPGKCAAARVAEENAGAAALGCDGHARLGDKQAGLLTSDVDGGDFLEPVGGGPADRTIAPADFPQLVSTRRKSAVVRPVNDLATFSIEMVCARNGRIAGIGSAQAKPRSAGGVDLHKIPNLRWARRKNDGQLGIRLVGFVRGTEGRLIGLLARVDNGPNEMSTSRGDTGQGDGAGNGEALVLFEPGHFDAAGEEPIGGSDDARRRSQPDFRQRGVSRPIADIQDGERDRYGRTRFHRRVRADRKTANDQIGFRLSYSGDVDGAREVVVADMASLVRGFDLHEPGAGVVVRGRPFHRVRTTYVT